MNLKTTYKHLTGALLLAAMLTTTQAAETNLAFNKTATQSSNQYDYTGSASAAVDGNTSGSWKWRSGNTVTHTQRKQGSWWQVDLGSDQDIGKINIYNRTDCCMSRLSNYRVTISNGNNTIVDTQDFSAYPNPKTTVNLGTQGKKGRYVKIQLLGNNFLSLAEVQVIQFEQKNKGEKGDKGDTGATGPIGLQGIQGVAGINGTDGIDGTDGTDGAAGVKGDKGDVGGDTSFFAQVGADEVSLKGQQNLSVASGYIQIGNSNSQCNADTAGALRYNTIIEYCNGVAWQSIVSNSLQSDDCGWACQLGSATSIGGNSYTCALKADNSVGCWGRNHHNQIVVPSGLIAKQIAVGSFHTCALKIDNTVECWGKNNYGQSTPPDGLIAKQIAVGGHHACALKIDNTVACWGYSGNGRTTAPDGLIAELITLGSDNACALKADNTVECWGKNINGIPPNDLTAKQIALGWYNLCALKIDNTVECWGRDSYGQSTPPDDLIAKQIALGAMHSCALKIDNTIECWGLDTYGQATPPDGLIAKQIVLGVYNSCALKTDDTIQCWGANSYGQVNNIPNDLIAKQL